jgi:hypothetical protein
MSEIVVLKTGMPSKKNLLNKSVRTGAVLAAFACIFLSACISISVYDPYKFTLLTMTPNTGIGYSVSISTDGKTMIVSALAQSNTNAGSASVYERHGQDWELRTVLSVENGSKNDLFGMSTAVSSDGSIVIVGAPGASVNSLAGAGSVYIFKRPSKGWPKEGKLKPFSVYESPDPQASGMFGNSIAIDAIGQQVVVGSPYEKKSAGTTYVFTEVIDSKLKGLPLADVSVIGYQNPAVGDIFGTSVAISSDGKIILVGAPGSRQNAGMALLFRRGAHGWSDAGLLKLAFPNYQATFRFGSKVGMSRIGDRLAVYGGGRVYSILIDWNSQSNPLKQMVGLFIPKELSNIGYPDLAISSDGNIITAIASKGSMTPSTFTTIVYASESGTWVESDTKTTDLGFTSWSIALSGDGTILVGGDPRTDSGKGSFKTQTVSRNPQKSK